MYYKDLLVWQKSMDLVVSVYKLMKLLPKDETFNLIDQIRRAVVSIPSNIAEGQSRKNNKEFVQFLYIAKGSKSELETQLDICKRVGYLTDNDLKQTNALLSETSKMLSALIKQLEE